MKKIKLVAPILGATATLGTLVPIISCGNQIKVECSISCDDEAQTVQMVGKLPKVEQDKPYNVQLVWTHKNNTTGQSVESSLINNIKVTELGSSQDIGRSYGGVTKIPGTDQFSTNLFISKDEFEKFEDFKGINIEISVHEAATYTVNVAKQADSGTKVEITSGDQIVATEGEDLDAVITWKQTTSGGDELPYSYLSDWKVTDHSGATIQEAKVVKLTEYNKTEIFVPSSKVSEVATIELTIKYVQGFDKSFELRNLASAKDNIIHNHKNTAVPGTYSNVIENLTDSDNTIEFIIPIAELHAALSKEGMEILDEKGFYLYFEKANKERSEPLAIGGVDLYIQGKIAQRIQGSFDSSVNSLYMPIKITQDILDNEGTAAIYGWYNYDLVVPGLSLNGGKICVFPGSCAQK